MHIYRFLVALRNEYHGGASGVGWGASAAALADNAHLSFFGCTKKRIEVHQHGHQHG